MASRFVLLVHTNLLSTLRGKVVLLYTIRGHHFGREEDVLVVDVVARILPSTSQLVGTPFTKQNQ